MSRFKYANDKREISKYNDLKYNNTKNQNPQLAAFRRAIGCTQFQHHNRIINMTKQDKNITHHLTDATLMAYASGALTEAFEVVVASHMTFCPLCRERATLSDSVGGYFLEQSEYAQPSLTADDMLKRIRLSEIISTENSSDPDSKRMNDSQHMTSGDHNHGVRIPKPLARRLPTSLDNLAWKPLAKGVQQFELGTGDKRQGAFKLLKIGPGTKLIEHEHTDHEMTLVLHGSYVDSLGRYRAGDVADLGPEHSHKPTIDSDEPCIALIASNAPARYKGILGKLIQPFADI